MGNKLSLGAIILAAALGRDRRTNEVILNQSTTQIEERKSFCSGRPNFPTAPFTVSYAQRGRNIDPDNNGNIGLLPEPFEVIFTYYCNRECDERTYPIGLQVFYLNKFKDNEVNFFSPNYRFTEFAHFNLMATDSNQQILIQNERDLFDQGYQLLTEENMACKNIGQRKRCRIRIESVYQSQSYIDIGSLNRQTIAMAFAPDAGGCNGLELGSIVGNYLVFGNQFTYE